jgi:membrane-associated PAP2 superfamily phosphatase
VGRAALQRVADDERLSLTALVIGSRRTIAGAVYGAIVVLAALTAGAKAFEHDLWHLTLIVDTTVIVLWIAHVYSHALGDAISVERRLTPSELFEIARRELAIPLVAVLPTAALVFGALGLLRERTAIWLAVGVGVATLTAQGFRYAEAERLGRSGTLIAVAINLGLGLIIVGLKGLVAH